jgi:hypothetical protein
MLLMAALAVAMLWDRGLIRDPFRWDPHGGNRANPGLIARLSFIAISVLSLLPPVLAAASVAVLGLRLRPPRPPLGVLAQEPGTIACALATLVVVPAAVAILAWHWSAVGSLGAAWRRAAGDLRPEYLGGETFFIAVAIGVTWSVMMARRRWPPVVGWADRLGRLLGVGWMLIIAASAVAYLTALPNLL